MRLKPFLLTLCIAVAAGFIFNQAGMFLPWMLGPLFSLAFIKFWYKGSLYWPISFRNFGLIILGVQLGSSFTKEAALLMVTQLPIMLVTTVLIIGFSVTTAFVLKRWTDLSYSTVLLGSFPGGLSQMVLLGEETKDADEAVIAFMQTFRVMMVITIVPWLIFHVVAKGQEVPVAAGTDINAQFLPDIDPIALIWLIAGLPVLIWAAKKISFPIPYLLMPLLLVGVLNIVGFQPPSMPTIWIDGAQLLFGTYLGVKMKFDKEHFSIKMLSICFVLNLLLIGFCILLAEGLYALFQLPFNEMFLSTAPGGIAEMAVTAIAVEADISTVTSFHLFRIFMILLIATPLMKFLFAERGTIQQEQESPKRMHI
ncbi:AbrB family transcriptional regulator [Bacillus litorisediminis]|uniref:AbrB family transcriptional regulator n=1 Tax=Bacillus litorisediminis TaxID=2922713 RepID=UPI001FAE30EA|nr:AbrB family transcriptional regulator [Bacillus litorisediminis]